MSFLDHLSQVMDISLEGIFLNGENIFLMFHLADKYKRNSTFWVP